MYYYYDDVGSTQMVVDRMKNREASIYIDIRIRYS